MKLHHYTVTVIPRSDPGASWSVQTTHGGAHLLRVDAPSALAALVQVANDAFSHTNGPVFVLDEDGELRELLGFKLGPPNEEAT